MPAIRPLSASLATKAAVELNETPDRIDSDLQAIREWLKKMPHIKARTDDQFLVAFLRGCKFSLEKVKEKLDMYYTVRTAIPELIANRDPLDPKTMAIIKLGVGVPLPNTNGPDSPRVMLIRPGTYNPEQFTIQDVMKVSTMMNDVLMMEDDNMIVAGQIGILDLANVGMSHFLQFNPTFVKKMSMMSQEASPLRQKGFHYVHTPKGFEYVFNLFKSFMSEKNKTRLYVHGDNIEQLYEHVPKKLLPAEYGGDGGPIQNIIDHWEKKMIDYRDFFLEEATFGTEEKKRPGRPKNSEALFGADGSFRQLSVD